MPAYYVVQLPVKILALADALSHLGVKCGMSKAGRADI